jgi:hypothetical protein
MNARTPHLDAIRLLFSIRAGSLPFTDAAMPDVVALFKGEARLLAFDFWIRNPDYLAAELLDLFEETAQSEYLSSAKSILDNGEPDLRRVPMIRYFFGAYERLDDALSLLRSRDLIRITGLKSKSKVQETDFLLTKKGAKLCDSCVTAAPILKWYSDRSDLVAKVAGDRGGTALKQRQYERTTYAETKLGGVIPPIGDEIFEMLRRLEERETAV